MAARPRWQVTTSPHARTRCARRSVSTGQFAAVDNQLSGRENLLLIGDLRHVADPAETAADLLRRFGLEEVADRRVSTFSGGMRRRLDIAMSLIGSPAVILPGRAHQRIRPGDSQ